MKKFFVVSMLIVLAVFAISCAAAPTPAPTAAPPTAAPKAATSAPAATTAPTFPPAPAEIVLGAAVALTGSSSNEGGQFKKAYDLAFKEVNANGGINVKEYGKKIPAKLILYDDKTDPTTAVTLYEKLATEDKVNFFLGGYSTAIVQAETVVPEKYQIPYVNGGGATEAGIYDRGFKNIFGLLPSIAKLSATLTKWMALQQDAGKLPKPLKIAVIAENTSHGVEFRKGFQDAAKAAPDRFQIVMDEAFELNLKDAEPLLQKVKAANADVFAADARVADYTTIQRRYSELALYHQVLSYGPRGPETAARTALGPASNYIVAANWWDRSLTDDSSKAFLKKYKDAYNNENPDWFAALGYETARTMFTAIENAGTLDRAKVRDALATIKLTPSLVIGGVIQFGANGQIQNDYLMTQNLPDGTNAIIYPASLATGAATVPYPKK
ncbi:MAG: amino acid ABC transporter substrate-binding protein [Chloroflexi bacterium]|nr:amino acid ABC transporter substrate-binding protein [Chloroflexota bacterium]